MIIREHYISQIRSFDERDLVKLITGIRFFFSICHIIWSKGIVI